MEDFRLTDSTRPNGTVPSTTSNHKDNEDYEEGEEEEEEVVEEEVREMAKKIREYRSTLPDQLKSCLSSLLESQRPLLSLPSDDSPSPGPHSNGAGSGSNPNIAANDGEQSADELKLLRDKISSNMSAIPKVLKRMNECISRIDRLGSCNETIHPAFKRKKS